MSYIQPNVETDPSILLQRVYDYLQANVPGWVPRDTELDVWLAQAFVSAVAEARDTASSVPTDIFRWFGATLLGLQPIDATRATTTVKFTAIDNKGYTVPAGTQIGVYIDGINYWPFRTLADAVIPVGQTVVDNVQVQATVAGAGGTALGGVGVAATLLDVLDFITTVVLDAATAGGVDAETDDVYLDRLTAELQLLSPRPILPNDFAVLARNIAGVYRAAAVDGYNPADLTYNNQRLVAVAVVDINGGVLSSGTKLATQQYLDAMREVNFVVNVMDPTFTDTQVVYTVQSLPGVDKVALKASIDAALKGYINPGVWGSTADDKLQFSVVNLIRYNKVVQLIDNVPGVDYIVSLQIGPQPGALTTNDIALTGPAPLPTLTQAHIAGTVN